MSQALAAFAAYLKDLYTLEVAIEELRSLRSFRPPIMRMIDAYSEEVVLRSIQDRQRKGLTAIAEGRGQEFALERLRQWVAGEVPELTPDNVEASDIVLTTLAEKQALLAFVPRYSSDPMVAAEVVEAIEAYYGKYRSDAMEVFLKTRAEAKLKALRNNQRPC